MGERLTKEREAEIRKYYAGEAQPSYYVPPEPGDYALADVRDLLAELDALRAGPPTTYLHADGTEEPIGELVARLTRERDGWRLRADDLTSQRDGQERDAIAARAEAGAERKARMALEARVRELLDAHAKLLDRLETAESRVRELEAERDEARLTALEDAAVLMEADASTAPRSRSRVLMEAAERIRRAVVTDGGSTLVDHAESVSARVAEWPEWKRREIRHFAIDRERGKNGGGL